MHRFHADVAPHFTKVRDFKLFSVPSRAKLHQSLQSLSGQGCNGGSPRIGLFIKVVDRQRSPQDPQLLEIIISNNLRKSRAENPRQFAQQAALLQGLSRQVGSGVSGNKGIRD